MSSPQQQKRAKTEPKKSKKPMNPKKRECVALDQELPLRKPGIQRLARKAGVERIAAGVYKPSCDVMVAFLRKIVGDAVVVTTHCGRNTIQSKDILYALKENGVNMY